MAAKKPLTAGSTGAEQIADADTLVVVGGVAIGQSGVPETTAIFEVESTTKGFLFPRMTTAQRDAITTPATGLIIYNTDTGGLESYNATRWQRETQTNGAPSFTIGSGWGTGATSSIVGDDLAGEITVTSGTGSLTATTLGTVTFNKAFPTGAVYAVFFHPSNTNAGGANMTYVLATSKAVGSFICDSSNSNITSRIGPSTAYKVYYHVIQYQ